MYFISPGVRVSEVDKTTSIPAVSTTEAGICGVYAWGPVGERVLVVSEDDLAFKFGKPSNFNAEGWFVGANFLQDGNSLYVVRADTGTSAMGVFAETVAPNADTQTVKNKDHYESGSVTFSSNVAFVSRYPGELGNSLKVSVCDSVDAYRRNINIVSNSSIIAATSNVSVNVGSSVARVSVGFTANGDQSDANTQAYAISASLQPGDKIKVGNTSLGEQYIKISSVGSVTGNSTISTFNVELAEPYRLRENWVSNTISRYWEFHDKVSGAPSTSSYVESFGNTAAVDELHVVVVDEDGMFTGIPGNILQVHEGLSRATDAKTLSGAANYYKTVINDNSRYIWWANDNSIAVSNTAANITSASTTKPSLYSFVGGTNGDDENSVSLSSLAEGYDLLADASAIDLSFVLAGKTRASDGVTLANYIIDNVSEKRKDCVSFISPPKEAVVNNIGSELDSVLAFSGAIRSSTYAFLDSGYKYQYDKYNDIYRWIPLNGDIAGLCVRTDRTNDAWWSPAGYNRGHIKNVTKLAWNPSSEAYRNELAKSSVNPVISETGEGTILFDDRTHTQKSSAFRALGVRRLFIILEKAIATDAKYALFEFNDEFTRAQFRNRTIPFLRDITGRRGITEFAVVCDSTNNTDEVINREEFVGDIYVKPNRSIRGIQLNFIAVRGAVTFNEVETNF